MHTNYTADRIYRRNHTQKLILDASLQVAGFLSPWPRTGTLRGFSRGVLSLSRERVDRTQGVEGLYMEKMVRRSDYPTILVFFFQ